MIMKTISSFLLLLIITGWSCSKDPDGPKQPKPINLPEKSHEIITSNNAFGIGLFRATALEEDHNFMLSPLSASTALTMLLNGCNGATYDQIRDMLGYQGLTAADINNTYNSLISQLLSVDPEISLSLANAVWYRQGFDVKDGFLGVMDSTFQARIGALDFSRPSSVDTINNWASDNTNGKIPKVINDIDPDMVMFLMNALYFKGNWTYKFKADQTSDLPFYLADETTRDVKMMRNTFPARYYYSDNETCLELTYGRQNFAMDIILPSATLDNYLAGFDATAWENITGALDLFGEPDEIEVILPKFKFDYEKILNDQLKALGMTDAFDPVLADLSGIADASLVVDFVKQNTYVDVNEEGTEAAAVTTIGIKEVSMPPSFEINKPFIFAIRERMTNTLLFIGKVELPSY